jgi:GAF domain-containing protein
LKQAKPKTADASEAQQPEAVALSALVRASANLLTTPQLSSVLPKILQVATEVLEVDAYAVWRHERGPAWRILHSAGLSDGYQSSVITGPAADQSLTEPLISEDVQQHSRVQERRELYKREGIRSIIALPLRTESGDIGTMAFYYRDPQAFSPSRIEAAKALANIAAAAINAAEMYEEQSRMRRNAEAEQRRAIFLGKATAELASSLDYSSTLSRVAALATPTIADWCSVHIVASDGTLERATVAHADPEKITLATEMQRRYPPDLKTGSLLARVVASGKAELVTGITDAMLQQGAQDAEHLRMMRELGMRSLLVVPIKSLNTVLGVLTLVTAESERELESEDLRLAEDLAARAAVAVENARLYKTVQEQLAETRAAEEKIRIADERLRLAQSVGKVATWELDVEDEILTLSPEASNMLGVAFSNIALSALIDLMYVSGDRDRFSQALTRTLRSNRDLGTEFRARRGQEVRVISTRGKLFYNAGKPLVVGIFIDVTRSGKESGRGQLKRAAR